MKILLIGCNGLLGQNLIEAIPDDIEIKSCSLEDKPFHPKIIDYTTLDMTERDSVKKSIDIFKPDWIFNAAAMTNVDLCESEVELCEKINRDSVGFLAESGIPLVHISTDYVFDGDSGPYAEDDTTQPLGVYGRTKLESEEIIFKHSEDSLLIRTMLLWGRGYQIRPSYVDFVKNSLKEKKEIKIVTDQKGNPTLASDLAYAIWQLIEKGCKGLYHVSGSEIVSRYEWAVQVAEYYNLDKGLIKTCTTSELGQAAARPLNSGFTLDKLQRDTGFIPKNVIDQIQFVEQFAQ